MKPRAKPLRFEPGEPGEVITAPAFGTCSCEMFECAYPSYGRFLSVRYGCPLHCPAPPSPIVTTVEESFGARGAAALVIEGQDEHDPWRYYEARFRAGDPVYDEMIAAVRKERGYYSLRDSPLQKLFTKHAREVRR